MSQIIIINSSDEEKRPPPLKTEKQSDTKIKDLSKNVDYIFEKFFNHCKRIIMQSSDVREMKILQYLRQCHVNRADKSSRAYRKLLQRSVKKLNASGKDIFVHIHNVITGIEKSSTSSPSSLASGISENISNTSPPANDDVKPMSVTEDSKASEEPSTSKHNDDPTASKRPKVEIDSEIKPNDSQNPQPSTSASHSIKASRRIKILEKYLKSISKEIIRLQSSELSLDDLESENSSYILESKLKERFVKAHKELCRLKQCKPIAGRIMEKRIHVNSSIYPAINRKIELFLNNPKREQNLPDYADICTLVKKASLRNNLDLSAKDIEDVSKNIFEEVGQKMQKRRHRDFIFEFGCSAVDTEPTDTDPATSDSALQAALTKNREIAVKNLEGVINKYASMKPEVPEYKLENDESLKEPEDIQTLEQNKIIDILPH